ncbi:TIGR02594 family protein [Oricola indica]|jgi:uncharacterized protein (TIGR02594 family)|uniref:NlpC/P60 family protein n=1 Tax=Oricola indica TaxID=2872591 RepID=UPI002367810F|nr:TIGR02594 family protein [Oricola indica]
MTYTTANVQRRLKQLGFDPGPIDGLRGRKTISAVKEFQLSRGLVVDGIVGPVTLAHLFDAEKKVGTPQTAPDYTPWMDLARRKMGLHEGRDNSVLRAFLRLGKGTIGDPARIPWCGDFVETCIAVTLPDEPLPDNPYAAINWLKFGREVKPQPGAILVFWRGSPSGWQGHVGFCVGEDDTHFHVLGGNQSNAVTISRIAKSRLRKGGCRWPSTAMPARGLQVRGGGSGIAVTTNEA